MNRAYFPKEKRQNSQKKGEIHELFVLALSLAWFGGATPELRQENYKETSAAERVSLTRSLGFYQVWPPPRCYHCHHKHYRPENNSQ